MANKNDIKASSEETARNLRHEYSKGTEGVQDAVNDLRDNVREAAENVREEYDRRVDQVHQQWDQSIDGSRKSVQEHPFVAVGVALAVGILAGLLIRRNSNA
jgi:ElaB/YqjD/DUF883 family membrane-anchored ribosome-binding protein